ncbi:hypothetical protein B0H19DRAFT_1262082 [Mycena capillaripes]|nr:hypothetical protein B0H19DRAFT_1262082 [Mycena capillaripes]
MTAAAAQKESLILGRSDSSSSTVANLAVDMAGILVNLSSCTDFDASDHSDGEPFTLEQFQELKNQSLLRQNHDPDAATASQRAITMMELQRGEDDMTEFLQRLLDLGVSRESLADHISQSVADQLFKLPPKTLPGSLSSPLPMPGIQCNTSSPTILLPNPICNSANERDLRKKRNMLDLHRMEYVD